MILPESDGVEAKNFSDLDASTSTDSRNAHGFHLEAIVMVVVTT